ncbi:MAG: hypothetical protein RR550_00265 [Rikenellaceae bacterium]
MIKIKVFLLAIMLTATSVIANAQTEGGVFNPYSQYGLGELSTLGTAASKGMGGIGVATRDRYSINMLNPAAYTMIERQNAVFSIGGEGVNNYLKTAKGSNSKNFFNLGHIGLQLRIAKRFGFGMSVAPYSDMGYELSITDKGSDVITNIGNIRFDYVGSGGIAQFKGGFAYNPFGQLNIGINYIYYLGNFKQEMSSVTTAYIDNGTIYKNIYDTRKAKINQSSFEIGAQYVLPLKNNGKALIFGATFQPRIASKMKKDLYLATGSSQSTAIPNDVVRDTSFNEKYYFPLKVSFGASYNTTKLHLEANYTYQDWKGSFPENNVRGLSYNSRHEVRAGVQYTPNRFDIRSQLKRWSYRAGMTYGTSYIVKNGVKTNDYSGTIGIGIPMEREWFSMLNIAAEYGTSGVLKENQIRNNFIKLNIGFTFAARGWFMRYKYK